MVRIWLVLLVVVISSACSRKPEDFPFMVYNGCNGSWLRVSDANGNLLINRLDYGQEKAANVMAYKGSWVTFLAVGFELATGRPLGSTTTTRFINGNYSGGSFSFTSPTNALEPWQITSLFSSDANAGCFRR